MNFLLLNIHTIIVNNIILKTGFESLLLNNIQIF